MPVNETETLHHIHLVSDATGETINSIARACIVQFDNVKAQEHCINAIKRVRYDQSGRP